MNILEAARQTAEARLSPDEEEALRRIILMPSVIYSLHTEEAIRAHKDIFNTYITLAVKYYKRRYPNRIFKAEPIAENEFGVRMLMPDDIGITDTYGQWQFTPGATGWNTISFEVPEDVVIVIVGIQKRQSANEITAVQLHVEADGPVTPIDDIDAHPASFKFLAVPELISPKQSAEIRYRATNTNTKYYSFVGFYVARGDYITKRP